MMAAVGSQNAVESIAKGKRNRSFGGCTAVRFFVLEVNNMHANEASVEVGGSSATKHVLYASNVLRQAYSVVTRAACSSSPIMHSKEGAVDFVDLCSPLRNGDA